MLKNWSPVLCALFLAACEPAPPTCAQRLAAMPIAELTLRQYDGPRGESAEGATIEHGYDAQDVLRQVTVTFFGERGKRQIQYAIAEPDVFTMVVNDTSYAQPISPDRPTEGGRVASSFFSVCDGELLDAPGDASKASPLAAFIERLPEFSGAP